jgi:2',3'-cyclic-nucleotide 2'-phosphodiesterase (5'-nucleotidase family)
MKVKGLFLIASLVFLSSCNTRENRLKGKSFTILNTNDLHSSFIGMGPSSAYTPFELNNDSTIGGYARLAGLIKNKKESTGSKVQFWF